MDETEKRCAQDKEKGECGCWNTVDTWKKGELGRVQVRLCSRVGEDLRREEEKDPNAGAFDSGICVEDEVGDEDVEAGWECGEWSSEQYQSNQTPMFRLKPFQQRRQSHNIRQGMN